MRHFHWLNNMLEHSGSKSEKRFDIFIQSLILISIVSFTIETIPHLSTEVSSVIYVVELFSIIVFTIEYFLRILVSDRPLRFIFSFYGIIDLIAFIPFYFFSGIDLRSIRIFRLFRLIRIFKIFRYSKALNRYKRAFSLIKPELTIFMGAVLFLFYISSVGIYYCENHVQPDKFSSVFDCMWWSITTLATIGYGDIVPATIGGKIFTFIIVITGIGFVAIPSGLFASAITKSIEMESNKREGAL